jgi:hypothetical protein
MWFCRRSGEQGSWDDSCWFGSKIPESFDILHHGIYPVEERSALFPESIWSLSFLSHAHLRRSIGRFILERYLIAGLAQNDYIVSFSDVIISSRHTYPLYRPVGFKASADIHLKMTLSICRDPLVSSALFQAQFFHTVYYTDQNVFSDFWIRLNLPQDLLL